MTASAWNRIWKDGLVCHGVAAIYTREHSPLLWTCPLHHHCHAQQKMLALLPGVDSGQHAPLMGTASLGRLRGKPERLFSPWIPFKPLGLLHRARSWEMSWKSQARRDVRHGRHGPWEDEDIRGFKMYVSVTALSPFLVFFAFQNKNSKPKS